MLLTLKDARCLPRGRRGAYDLSEHYELPGELFTKYGGWGSKHVVDLFVRYAEAAFQRFGRKVRYWFAFNEPVVVQTRVYLDSERWPFEQNSQKWMDWNYNKALATNRVMKLFKEGGYRQPGGKFGTIINVEMAYPAPILPTTAKLQKCTICSTTRFFGPRHQG